MKILVADKISPKGVAYLRQQPGFEVVEAYGSSPEKVKELVKDVHAIAVRSETKITAEIMAAAPLLKVVGRAGVGVRSGRTPSGGRGRHPCRSRSSDGREAVGLGSGSAPDLDG